MTDETKIPGTKQVPLTKEELLARREILVNMKTMTMRRAFFNSLRPCRTPFPAAEVLRERAVALLIVHDKNTNIRWAYFLLDDQTFIRGSPYPEHQEEWPESHRFLLDLPYVQVT